jgi:hypothetical protein
MRDLVALVGVVERWARAVFPLGKNPKEKYVVKLKKIMPQKTTNRL